MTNDNKQSAKTVLITGASSGFGRAAALRLAQTAGQIILLARRQSRLVELQKVIEQTFPHVKVHSHAMDLRDDVAVDALPTILPETFREVDLLVNNAGLALGLNGAWECSLQEWDDMLMTNCRALVRLTRRLLPGMVERNRGHIINLGSVAGNWPYPGGNVYGATKAFVQQFSRNLRCDLLGKNIRVTNIEPGMADTEFSLVRFSGDKAKADKVYEGTRALSAEDVAETIFWASSLPEHVNINTLEVMPVCQAWAPFAVNREMASPD